MTVLVMLAIAYLGSGCATNPATGQRQLTLITESQEIAMGRESDPAIVASIGLYPDDGLQAYVARLGQGLAADSERPNLPWSFKVVDDEAVNAFAVPGGFIYVTRGILAALNSEAELVGVIGHEIGHVTARHSVNQMSRMQLQQLGLGIGSILSEGVARYGGLIQSGLQVLNLSYSRGDESEADRLGFRYMTRESYDPNALIGVFETLASVSGTAQARLPEWQLTHPYPENRAAQIREMIDSSGRSFSGFETNRDEYIRLLDGLVYGPDPREGYFKENEFSHPEFALRLDFPPGWRTSNQKSAVAAMSEAQDAIFALTLAADATDPTAALGKFLNQEGVTAGRVETATINGLRAARAPFSASTQDGQVRGEIAFVSLDGSIYQMIGYGTAGGWPSHAAAVSNSIGSFRRLTDPAALAVQPRRVEIVRLDRAMTWSGFLGSYPSTIPPQELASINRASADASFEAGTLLKRVVGGELP